ncbi:MAG: hypothetical protein WA231_01050 [Methylocella sp.]
MTEIDPDEAREAVSQDDENYREKFFDFVQAVLATDDDSDRALNKLRWTFPHYPPEYRAGINHAFVRLCGWQFDTTIHAFETGMSMSDASERQKSTLDLETDKADDIALGLDGGK